MTLYDGSKKKLLDCYINTIAGALIETGRVTDSSGAFGIRVGTRQALIVRTNNSDIGRWTTEEIATALHVFVALLEAKANEDQHRPRLDFDSDP